MAAFALGTAVGGAGDSAPTTTSTAAAPTRAPAGTPSGVGPTFNPSPLAVPGGLVKETITQAGPLPSFSDGTYEVGTGNGQVAPGKYRSPGDGGTCYWGRLKNNDGELGDIIVNNLGQGQMLLTVKPSDGYVEIRGCTFTKVG